MPCYFQKMLEMSSQECYNGLEIMERALEQEVSMEIERIDTYQDARFFRRVSREEYEEKWNRPEKTIKETEEKS